jgi:VanZ family protein
LQWLFPNAGPELLENAQWNLRKTAHVVEYALLAVLALRAWRLSVHWPWARSALASLVLALGVAAVDELRQHAAPDREGSLSDVGLDMIGAALGLVLWRGMAGRCAS